MSKENNQTSHSIMMTPAALAEALQLSPRKIRAMKSTGQLPPAINFGRSIRWRRADVLAWIEAQIANATNN